MKQLLFSFAMVLLSSCAIHGGVQLVQIAPHHYYIRGVVTKGTRVVWEDKVNYIYLSDTVINRVNKEVRKQIIIAKNKYNGKVY